MENCLGVASSSSLDSGKIWLDRVFSNSSICCCKSSNCDNCSEVASSSGSIVGVRSNSCGSSSANRLGNENLGLEGGAR